MIARDRFYAAYREDFEAIKLESTVNSINTILSTFEKYYNQSLTRYIEKWAYMLATVRHEVGYKMLPIAENLNYSSAKRIHQVWPSRFPTVESAEKYVKNPVLLGNKVYGGRMGNGLFEGYKFRGRGIGAQITGYDNYNKFSRLLDVDLINNPELAMSLDIGAEILYRGMTEGLFTGLKLSGFIKANSVDYVNARKIVNGDVAANGKKIAEDAKKFQKILEKSI